MDFKFTDSQHAWRTEVRTWLRANLPASWGGGDFETETPDGIAITKDFHRKLAAKGWLVMAWPKEYGGGGAGIVEQLIFNEEYGYHRAPYLGPGVHFIGPSIMIHGSEEHKQRYLPRISGATEYWCQGFSEPNHGSDLASLQTRAVLDGDEFVVNGTKIWTSFGHFADQCYLAVRTDENVPKHKGISVLLVDMKTPGISMRPIVNMAGVHSFNQVFFDDVRVPRTQLLGTANRGWYIMMDTLGFERSMIASSSGARRTLEDITEYARTTKTPEGTALSSDPVIASKLTKMAIEVEVARLLAYNTASVQLRGRVPDKEASYSKLFANEMVQRLAQTGMEILGPVAPLKGDGKWSALRGKISTSYLASVSGTIASGSSEIQRGIIASRGLGMPR